MNSILRLSNSLRPNILRTLREQNSKMPANFFARSHSPTGLGLRTGLADPFSRAQSPSLRRLYSSRSGSSPGNFSAANMMILWGFIGVNLSVFAACKYLQVVARQGTPEPFMKFYRNFTLNVNTVFSGRYWVMMTSVFTHMDFMHILGNLFSFYYMGQLVAKTPGITPPKLIVLVLGSGLTGSLGYISNRLQSMVQQGTKFDSHHGLGFSGAVMGVGMAAACMYPTAQFALYGVIPIPLWGLMAGYFVYDGYYLGSENTSVAHAGHLGGLVFGAAYYFLSLRRGLFRHF